MEAIFMSIQLPIDSIVKARISGFIVTVKIVRYLQNDMIKVTGLKQFKPFKIKMRDIIEG